MRETAVQEESRWSWASLAISFGALVLAASPGVVAAGSALSGGNSRAADYIQVFYRLAHHLDPTTITARAWIGYSALFTGWLLLRPWESRTGSQRWWSGCVLMSLLIALTGAAIGWGPRPPQGVPWLDLRMRLMKFYPFRLFDLVMPTAVAFSFAGLLGRWVFNAGSPASHRLRTSLSCVIAGGLLTAALIQAKETRFHPPVPEARQAAWREVCAWIERETPTDSVFLTPRETWGFKWFAQRPEYVAYKDCPQDSAGIIEWNRRLQRLAKWADEEWKEGYSVAALQRLHKQTGITYILARDLGPFETTPLYDNGEYRVIRIPRSDREPQALGR